MDEQIVLNGSYKEQANQLWEILKNKELSSEALQTIMPNAIEFFKELFLCIKNESDSDKEISKLVIDVYKQNLSDLIEGLTKKELNIEEKKLIADRISEINKYLCDVAKSHSTSSVFKTMFLTGAIVVLSSIFISLASKNKGFNNSTGLPLHS